MAGSVRRSRLAVRRSVSALMPPLTSHAIWGANNSPSSTSGVIKVTQRVSKKEAISHNSARFSGRAYVLKTGTSAALTMPPASKS